MVKAVSWLLLSTTTILLHNNAPVVGIDRLQSQVFCSMLLYLHICRSDYYKITTFYQFINYSAIINEHCLLSKFFFTLAIPCFFLLKRSRDVRFCFPVWRFLHVANKKATPCISHLTLWCDFVWRVLEFTGNSERRITYKKTVARYEHRWRL